MNGYVDAVFESAKFTNNLGELPCGVKNSVVDNANLQLAHQRLMPEHNAAKILKMAEQCV